MFARRASTERPSFSRPIVGARSRRGGPTNYQVFERTMFSVVEKDLFSQASYQEEFCNLDNINSALAVQIAQLGLDHPIEIRPKVSGASTEFSCPKILPSEETRLCSGDLWSIIPGQLQFRLYPPVIWFENIYSQVHVTRLTRISWHPPRP